MAEADRDLQPGQVELALFAMVTTVQGNPRLQAMLAFYEEKAMISMVLKVVVKEVAIPSQRVVMMVVRRKEVFEPVSKDFGRVPEMLEIEAEE